MLLQIRCLALNAPQQRQGRSLQAAGGASAGASCADAAAVAEDGLHAALLTETRQGQDQMGMVRPCCPQTISYFALVSAN